MKLYIQKIGESWTEPVHRSDLESLSQVEYNAQGFYDFDPTPGPECDFNAVVSYEPYLFSDGVVRYRWTTTLKTGEALEQAIKDKWCVVRSIRTDLLNGSDYTQLSDAPMNTEQKAAWAVYRQALRDITLQSDPFALVWPTDPNGVSNSAGVVRV